MIQADNISQSDITAFNALANEWWNQQGALKTLHHINPARMDFIRNQINLTQQNTLDVGCGGGILAESLAQAGANVTGIDMADDILAVAREHANTQQLSINYQQTTAEQFANKHAGEFDVVTCLELLEHVPEPASIVASCSKLLKPGGHVFFSTLNRTAAAYLFAIVGAEYVLKLLPKHTHQYDQFIKPSELNQWARAHQLQLQSMTGLHYNPWQQQARLTPSLSINYMAHFCKI